MSRARFVVNRNQINAMRTLTRRQIGFLMPLVGALSAALVLSGCKKTPQQQILGKWRVEEKQSVVEYHKDGTYVATQDGKTSTGNYSFPDDSHLEWNISTKSGTNTIILRINCEIVFHGDKADLTTTIPSQPGAPGFTNTIHYIREK